MSSTTNNTTYHQSTIIKDYYLKQHFINTIFSLFSFVATPRRKILDFIQEVHPRNRQNKINNQ